MWQEGTFDPATIDRELGFAEKIGMNLMRVYLHDLLHRQDESGFFERLETYLSIAEKHHIKTMFVIFDDCWKSDFAMGPQPQPVPNRIQICSIKIFLLRKRGIKHRVSQFRFDRFRCCRIRNSPLEIGDMLFEFCNILPGACRIRMFQCGFVFIIVHCITELCQIFRRIPVLFPIFGDLPGCFLRNCRAASGVRRKRPINNYLLEAQKIIDHDFSNPELNIQSLSEILHVNRVQLSREFSRQHGVTISAYLRNLRLQKGLKMLRETRLSIRETALSCGFASADYFGKVITAATGEIPTSHRRSDQ